MSCRLFGALLGASLLALGTACAIPRADEGAGTGDRSSSGGANGTGNGGPGGSGNPGSGPGGSAAGGFMVTGRVALAPGQSSAHTLDNTSPSGSTAKQVTHVIGVTPSSQNTRRVVAKVEPTGAFALDLDPSRLWVLVFVDATKVGSDMIVGVFRAKGLDTLAPTKKGKADLGDVKAKDGAVDATLSYDELLAAMGIDPTSALYLSSIDDMCLRVVNPDVDGNGKIDALEDKRNDYRLDFHVQFAMRTDHVVSLDDMIGSFLPDSVTLTYGGTGIVTSFPNSAFADGWQSSLSASFDEELHYAPMGGISGPDTPLVAAAGSTIPASGIGTFGYGDYSSVELMAVPGFDLPQGTYRWGIGATTLTFTNVRTATDAQLAAAESFIMPFIRIVKVEPSCTTSCAIRTIDYEWRKRTAAGWIAATEGEIALVVGEQGGFLSIRLANDPAKNVGFVIPPTSVSGTVPWSSAMAPDDATRAAAVNATTADLCHVGLSYDDKLGMRYFGGIGEASGTCGVP